jgi:hypothetical protein
MQYHKAAHRSPQTRSPVYYPVSWLRTGCCTGCSKGVYSFDAALHPRSIRIAARTTSSVQPSFDFVPEALELQGDRLAHIYDCLPSKKPPQLAKGPTFSGTNNKKLGSWTGSCQAALQYCSHSLHGWRQGRSGCHVLLLAYDLLM